MSVEPKKTRYQIYRDKNPEKVLAAAREQQRRFREKHPNYSKEYCRKYRAENKGKERERDLKEKYGITHDAYEVMAEAQGRKCAICDGVGTRKHLSVDHCHTTGAIRGLLCNRCNLAIGMLKDDRGLLLRAAEYLCKFGDI